MKKKMNIKNICKKMIVSFAAMSLMLGCVPVSADTAEASDKRMNTGRVSHEMISITCGDDSFLGTDRRSGYSVRKSSALKAADTAEDEFINDCSTDYAFRRLADEQNGEALQQLYIRIRDVYKEVYCSQDDYDNGQMFESKGKKYYIVNGVRIDDLGIDADTAINVVLSCVEYDHPLFYFIGNMTPYSDDGSAIYPTVLEEFSKGSTRQGYNEQIKNMITGFAAKAENLNSNKEIITMVHDTIADKLSYAYESDGMTPKNNEFVHNILSYVVGVNEAVCDGYTNTMAAVLNYLDVENIIVVGWGLSSGSSEKHAWNLVRLGNGKYYYVDVTWDDALENTIYFCAGRGFENDHSLINEKNDGTIERDLPYELPDEIGETNHAGRDGRLLAADPEYKIGSHWSAGNVGDNSGNNSGNTGDNSGNNGDNSGNTGDNSGNTGDNPGKNGDNTGDNTDKTGTTEQGFSYSVLTDKTVAITGYTGTDAVVSIPSEINGYTVTSIENCFNNNNTVRELTLPDTIYNIGLIGYGCSSLEKLTINAYNPGDETYVYYSYTKGMFANCPKLTTITVNENENFETLCAYDNILYMDEGYGLYLILYPAGREDEKFVIPEYPAAETDGNASEKVVRIGENAFSGCRLKEIEIPESVSYIEKSAFKDCIELEKCIIYNNYINFDAEYDAVTDKIWVGCSKLTIYCSSNSNTEKYAQKYGKQGDGSSGLQYSLIDSNANEDVVYSVFFEANGGKVSLVAKNVIVGKKYSTLPVPVRLNYTFSGWYTAKKGGSRVTASTIVNITGDQTLYAHWTKVSVKKLTISSVKKQKKQKALVKWKKVSGAKGYLITYALDKKFKKGKKTVTVSAKSLSRKVTKLKKGKTYYVKVQAYKLDSAKKRIYGACAKIKKVKM